MKNLYVVLMCWGLLSCDNPKPAYVPVDLTPSLVEKCKTDWPNNKKLRNSCIAAVKSVPNWSHDPNGPKTIGDTCKERFPDNTTLRLNCLERGMDDETNAKIKQAERDAN